MRIEKSNKCDICDNSFARNQILQNYNKYVPISFWSENKFFIGRLLRDPSIIFVLVLVGYHIDNKYYIRLIRINLGTSLLIYEFDQSDCFILVFYKYISASICLC